MKYFDAHNHLQDARLRRHRDEYIAELTRLSVAGAVVNGTREADWEAVADLSAEHTWITPSYGLHPWHVAQRSEGWLDRLRELLQSDPTAGVGEIGLDRWIEGHDAAEQTRVFLPQLALATELKRPVTIHCLRAWGALWDLLRSEPVPVRCFLVHAYGGSAEMAEGFARLGAYFSFNAYFLHSRKAAQRDAFRQVPLHRLLVETDAPDLCPPVELNPRPVEESAGVGINHPGNIDLAYRGLAELRGMDVEELAGVVEGNYQRLFGEGGAG